MDAIISQYKGKVVVVDFWATWCGPCMQAMKEIEPLTIQFSTQLTCASLSNDLLDL